MKIKGKSRITHSKSSIEALKRYSASLESKEQVYRKSSKEKSKSKEKLPLYIYLNKHTHLNLLSLQTETLKKFHQVLKNQHCNQFDQQYLVIRRSKTFDGRKIQAKKLIVSEAEGQAFIAQNFHNNYLHNERVQKQFEKLKLLTQKAILTEQQISCFESRNDSRIARQVNKQINKNRKIYRINQSMQSIQRQICTSGKRQNFTVVADYLVQEITKLERLVFAKSIVKIQNVLIPKNCTVIREKVDNSERNTHFIDNSFDSSPKKPSIFKYGERSIFVHRTIYRNFIAKQGQKLTEQQFKVIQRVDRQYDKVLKVELLSNELIIGKSTQLSINKCSQTVKNQQAQSIHVKIYFQSAYPPIIMLAEQIKRIIGNQLFYLKLKTKIKTVNEEELSNQQKNSTQNHKSKKKKMQKIQSQKDYQQNSVETQLFCHICCNYIQTQQNRYICNKKVSQSTRSASSFNDPFTYLTFHIDYKRFVGTNSYIHPYFRYQKSANQDGNGKLLQGERSLETLSSEYLCNRIYCQKCFNNHNEIQEHWPSCMHCSKSCVCFRCQKMQRIVKMMASYLDNLQDPQKIQNGMTKQKIEQIQQKVAAFLLKKLQNISKYFVFPQNQGTESIFDLRKLKKKTVQERQFEKKERKRLRYVQPKIQLLQRGERPRKLVNKQFF